MSTHRVSTHRVSTHRVSTHRVSTCSVHAQSVHMQSVHVQCGNCLVECGEGGPAPLSCPCQGLESSSLALLGSRQSQSSTGTSRTHRRHFFCFVWVLVFLRVLMCSSPASASCGQGLQICVAMPSSILGLFSGKYEERRWKGRVYGWMDEQMDG